MAYQAYVKSLVDKGCVMGGVYDITHGTPWHDTADATSCKATAEEVLHVKAGILASNFNPEKPPHLEGVKYTEMGREQGKFAMMKSNHPQSEDRQMATVWIGRKFIMIGAMKGPAERGCMGAVEDIGKYLDEALGA